MPARIQHNIDSVMGDAWFPGPPVKVFYSYSHEDAALRQELDIHMAGLHRDHVTVAWSDREIGPGVDWNKEIDEKLNDAGIVLLLISPDFVASDYCIGIELERALERGARGECRVIPVLLRSYHWRGAPFAKFQALPSNGKPVKKWKNRDDAWRDVVGGIERAAVEIRAEPAAGERRDPAAAREHVAALRAFLQAPSFRWRQPLILYAALIVLALAFQYLARVLDFQNLLLGRLWPYALVDPGYYWARKSLAVANRPTENVAVVTLTPGVEPEKVVDERYARRAFLSQVLDAVRRQNPRVVVLDYWFFQDGPKTSAADRAVTAALIDAVQRFAGTKIPVVIARVTEDNSAIGKLFADEQVLQPGQIDFQQGRLDLDVVYALPRFNADVMKVPLGWPTYASRAQPGDARPHIFETLSWAAATHFNGTLLEDPVLYGWYLAAKHPFTTLVPRQSIQRVDAISLACSVSPAAYSCDGIRPVDISLSGRVVLIGHNQPGSEDWFDTPAGGMPGVMLHANYVLSLLDDRLYPALPIGWHILLGACVFAAIEVAFRRLHPAGIGLAAAAAAVVLVSALAMIYVVSYWKECPIFWLPFIPAAVARYALARKAFNRPGPV